MTRRTCDIDGCGRKHLAKGYCGTHYNQLVLGEQRRHPKAAADCIVCGSTVLRRTDSRTQYETTCSVACRTVVQWGHRLAPPLGYDWRTDAVNRARKAGATDIKAFDREEIFDRDAWTCQACEIRCSSPNPFERTAATVDHRIPLSLGGAHTPANAQTLCLSCNSAKRARTAASDAA